MDPTVPAIGWTHFKPVCQQCGTPLAGRRDAVIHIRHDEVRQAEADEYGAPARWQAHCMACNPHQHEDDLEHSGYICLNCYTFDLGNTLDWNEHLNGKGWMPSTDWSDFYSRHGGF